MNSSENARRYSREIIALTRCLFFVPSFSDKGRKQEMSTPSPKQQGFRDTKNPIKNLKSISNETG